MVNFTAEKPSGGEKRVNGTSQEVCPNCKANFEQGSKFCTACGQALVVTCANCKVDYPSGTNFCKQCGKKLE